MYRSYNSAHLANSTNSGSTNSDSTYTNPFSVIQSIDVCHITNPDLTNYNMPNFDLKGYKFRDVKLFGKKYRVRHKNIMILKNNHNIIFAVLWFQFKDFVKRSLSHIIMLSLFLTLISSFLMISYAKSYDIIKQCINDIGHCSLNNKLCLNDINTYNSDKSYQNYLTAYLCLFDNNRTIIKNTAASYALWIFGQTALFFIMSIVLIILIEFSCKFFVRYYAMKYFNEEETDDFEYMSEIYDIV